MNKNQFLAELRHRLRNLPQAEVEGAIAYYTEYFDEAGEENQDSIIAELGSPAAMAAKIIGEYGLNDAQAREQAPEEPKKRPFWVVVTAICAAPIALPLAIAVIAVAFALMVSLFSIVLSIWASGIALMANGLICLITGFRLAVMHGQTSLFYFGYAFFQAALGLLIFVGACKLSKKAFLWMQRMLSKFLMRISGKLAKEGN